MIWICVIGIREALQPLTLAQSKIPFFVLTFYWENFSNTKLLEAVVRGILWRAGTLKLFQSFPAHLTPFYGSHLLSDVLSPIPTVCSGTIPNAASVVIFPCLSSSVKITLLFTGQRISSQCHFWGLSWRSCCLDVMTLGWWGSCSPSNTLIIFGCSPFGFPELIVQGWGALSPSSVQLCL